MAPKGKPAPAPGGAPGDDAPPVALKSNRFKWMVIRVLTLLMSFAFIVLLILYLQLLMEGRDPLEEHMVKLKDILATGYGDKFIMFDTHVRAAEELVKVPVAMEEAENEFYEKKSQYPRWSSQGAWPSHDVPEARQPQFGHFQGTFISRLPIVCQRTVQGKTIGPRRSSPLMPYSTDESLFKKSIRSTDAWQIFGRSLYYISRDKRTWHDAEDFCLSRGAHLASILSDKEQLFVSSQLDQPAWIGLTDANEEGSWEWTDGSRLVSEYWSPGSPDHPKDHGEIEHDCTAMLDSSDEYNWNDASCNDYNGWVCKQMLDVAQ
ncbi:C-type lectin domain family 4 member E-like [Varanus komodoensis]|uniref:C-type lectin domain family 4 member E-like n=1 Tax=Varanus komodoensis TaxID=61221 RepID=UPI001CF78AAF|nr:C-type lectin domain family 4 member E-like [Varanus komodoensis]